MSRYGVAAVVGCLYVACSVWLVRSEGQSYREALLGARTAAKATPRPDPVAEQTGPIETASTEPNNTKSPAPPPEPSGVEPSPAAAGSPQKKPAEETTPRATPEAGVALAKAATPAPPARDPFWDRPEVKKSWDLSRLTTDDEIRLGNDLHEMILRFNRPLDDGNLQRRVEEAADPLLKTCHRKEIPYTFTILNTDAVNAFSHPGGYVYVTKGLLDMIAEDEDYALEFAIGHEMAHVDLQHALRWYQDPKLRDLGLGTLLKFYFFIIPAAYLDEQEFQADEWIYRRMKQRDRTDRECLAYLRKLDDRATKYNYAAGRGKPQPGRDTSPLDNHLRAHTAPFRRLKHLKEEVMAKK